MWILLKDTISIHIPVRKKEFNLSSCRICQAPESKTIGQFKPYQEFQTFEVFECESCRCRFVWRKEAVHESMHAAINSPYAPQKKLAEKIAGFYRKKEIKKAKNYLSRIHKYRFIIDHIALDPEAKLLEFGCALGYLTSYFLMQNMDIVGIDISKTAILQAIELFGHHFQLMQDDFFDKNKNQFDYVFHTGTIGCVQDPIYFTKQALRLLKPGGYLLFNAPDKKAASEMEAIWVNDPPPPDLITLFDETFWNRYFHDCADVFVTHEPYSHISNAKKTLNHLLRRSYLSLELKQMYSANQRRSSLMKAKFLPALPLLILSKLNLIHHFRNEFGMFVILTKK